MRLVRHALAASLLCLALPVSAALFDDDEARARIEQLRAEFTALAARVDTVSRNQLDFANQFEAIKTDIAALRGQIEVLTYELDAAQKRQRDFYVDLDTRLRKLEQPPEAAAETPKTDPAAEARDYEAALNGLKASKFREAGASFLAFIAAYPASSLLPSAYYWGGYAHAQAKDHAKAAELFGTFVSQWPDDERTPGALESRVGSLERQKDFKAARTALEHLAAKYPASDAGKRAQARLKKK